MNGIRKSKTLTTTKTTRNCISLDSDDLTRILRATLGIPDNVAISIEVDGNDVAYGTTTVEWTVVETETHYVE